MDKLKVYHFYNGSGGGVRSVIKNLIRFKQNPAIENHIVHAINTKLFPNYSIEPMQGAVTEQLCLYSPNDNFYHTCKKLAACLPNEKALVVAHDWVELGMMSNLGLQNKVVNFLHGDYDYYYQLAAKHQNIIDLYIPVAKNIETNLKLQLPNRTNDINYLRFPVPEVATNLQQRRNNFIFIGRLENAKGYHLLPKIAEGLIDKNIQWHIVGEGFHDTKDIVWNKNLNIKFYGKLFNAELLQLLPEMQILLLPSIAEGMPVALIEAMKAGVVPVVNDLDGGIQELVVDAETGYKIKNNDIDIYVDTLNALMENKELTSFIQQNCIQKANQLFNPDENTKLIENAFIELAKANSKNKVAFKSYGSRLDEPWIPNFITHSIRKF